jgi:hypothetical protein
MLVKMTVCLAGARFILNPGDEAEFAADEAIRLIDAGFAVPAKPKLERAVRKPRETR